MVLAFGQFDKLLVHRGFVLCVDKLAHFSDWDGVLGLEEVGGVNFLAVHEWRLVVGLG